MNPQDRDPSKLASLANGAKQAAPYVVAAGLAAVAAHELTGSGPEQPAPKTTPVTVTYNSPQNPLEIPQTREEASEVIVKIVTDQPSAGAKPNNPGSPTGNPRDESGTDRDGEKPGAGDDADNDHKAPNDPKNGKEPTNLGPNATATPDATATPNPMEQAPTPEGADLRFRNKFLDPANTSRTYVKDSVVEFTTLAGKKVAQPDVALEFDKLSNAVVVAWYDPTAPDSLFTEVFENGVDTDEMTFIPKAVGAPAPSIAKLDGALEKVDGADGHFTVKGPDGNAVGFAGNTQLMVPMEVTDTYEVVVVDGNPTINRILPIGPPTQ